jgi:MYXO-CTERM domain-containing protein
VTVRSYPTSNTTEQVDISIRGVTWDPDLSDNAASVSVPVSPRADLGGQASLWIDQNTIDLPITLGNSGPSIAQNVKAVIQLPEGISDATWTSNPPATCSQSGLELTCLIDEFSPSMGLSLDIKGGFSYHNQSVQVSGDISSDTIDPDMTNNHFAQALPENFLAGLTGGPAATSDKGGCGCAIGAKRPVLPALVISVLALFVHRRRRRP